MTYTTHYNLKKPGLADPVAVGDLNDNADAIDQAIYNASQSGGSATAMIESSVEAAETSAHAYAAGEHFIYNNTLYRATAAIAIGDTITPGTNCTAVTVAGELEGKVDKVPGKQLSTEDYTTAEKTKLSEIEAQANKTVIDSTLTQTGQAADAKATGDAVSELRNTLNHKADVIYDTASGDIVSFPDGADGLPVKDLTVAIEPVQDTSGGDPSPTRICPISGWTGCNVTRTGKNLWTNEYFATESNPLTLIDDPTDENYGYYTGSVARWADNYSSKPYGVFGNTPVNLGQITVSADFKSKSSSDTFTFRIFFIYSDGTRGYDGNITITNTAQRVSKTSNASKTCVGYFIATNAGVNNLLGLIKDVQVELGSEATDYAAYQGATYKVNFPSEAGTVYGGTLDVTSGVLTVDRATMDLGSLTYSKSSRMVNGFVSISGVPENFPLAPDAFDIPNWLCSQYKVYSNDAIEGSGVTGAIAWRISGQNKGVIIRDNTYSEYYANDNMTAFKDAMSGVQLVYELATPQTYQLTPEEVITTLLGQNNIWSDCGPSTVEYPADTKLYIQKINTPTDDDMIADANIASGQYFIVNNNLYLSTAAILAGDPIKPGTNCTLTNLAAALNALNS